MRNTQIAKELLLVHKFKKTAPEFQSKIITLAVDNNKDALTVYNWWREYSRDCTNFDQSPVFSEFETWYEKKLTE